MLNVYFRQMLKTSTQNKIDEVLSQIKDEKTNVVIPSGSGRSLIYSYICQNFNSTLIICRNEDKAYRLAHDLETWLGERVFVFPQREILPFETIPETPQVRGQRIEVLYNALKTEDEREGRIFITTTQAVETSLIPPEVLKQAAIKIRVGDRVSYDTTIEHLVKIGYKRRPQVEGPGDFSVRGDILDVFPLTGQPVRAELFDDEIDSIRYFNPEDQRSVESITEFTILPAREFVYTKESVKKAKESILAELEKQTERLRKSRLTKEAQELEDKVAGDLDKLDAGQAFDGELGYLPHFYGRDYLFFDYLKPNLVIFEDKDDLERNTDFWLKEIGESMSLLMEKGRVLPSVFDNFHSFSDVERKARDARTIYVNEIAHAEKTFEFRLRMPNVYQGPIEVLLASDLAGHLEQKRDVAVVVSTDERFERITKLFRDKDLPMSLEYQKGRVLLLKGNLESGFESVEDGLIVITDRELFGGAKRRKKPIFTQGKVLQSVDQLQPGDYVVHVNHGIGRYVGMNTLEINGTHRDYLVIEYAGEGEKLYIPTEQIQLLQKYSGISDVAPKLNKLGGSEWQKIKQRVNASVQAMAQELLELYAAREALRGHAFAPDDEFQHQFEDEFPYEETPDQLKAIREVKKDMTRPQPMERLLCGDVGFGKTEVAIRAAFKAVSEGKQVAVLVPTTILGMQHYNTFKDRFKNYPFNISLVSRFQSPKENRETLKKLAAGGVDIIIGTHRLLSKDVKFKDLGLVVIDEEQRFGVAQKEKLKYIKKNVDVLTMTATPIPRTLHMALVGVRDMSLIETPPEDRYPVRTYVTEYNPETIREAILRELARKGQIYFVSNRVNDIDEVAAQVQRLAPEARVAVAHGQMDEKYLEKIMIEFLNREYDILVCTTIIETGLDISNVNTLIVHNADQLGLAQLYQLRGRVGRTNRVAYAYFTYNPNKVLNEDAQKRLSAIRDFTELGSGIKLAMRDLEIRGAGNILGPEQHGFIAAVGFELYCQMLEEALQQRKEGQVEAEEAFEPQINITLDGYLPSSYIQNEGQKIEMYKKINAVSSRRELMDIEDELLDRYGTLPEEAENLLWFCHLKLIAHELLIEEIVEQRDVARGRKSLVVRFRPDAPLDAGRIQKVWEKYKTSIGFIHGKAPQIKVHRWDAKDWNARRDLLDILEILMGAKEVTKKLESGVLH